MSAAMDAAAGLGLVVIAGVLAGGGSGPIKWLRRYDYPQWAFIAGLTGLIVLPWAATLLWCPQALDAFASVPGAQLVKANLVSAAWGVANALAGLCLMRIGFSLTIGLLTGIGLPIGVILPLIVRGSGQFAEAPSLWSTGGLLTVGGVVVIVLGVALLTLAGFGRDALLKQRPEHGARFTTGLIMAIACGFLQVGLSFAFVYGQGPISAALLAHGAGANAAGIGVWAITLPGGALVCVGYAAWLLCRTRGWSVLLQSPRDLLLSLFMGGLTFAFIAAMGSGMRLMGPLGASIGFGVYQALQIGTAQAIGFASGEWRQVEGRPRRQMYVALGLLLLAVMMMATGKAVS